MASRLSNQGPISGLWYVLMFGLVLGNGYATASAPF